MAERQRPRPDGGAQASTRRQAAAAALQAAWAAAAQAASVPARPLAVGSTLAQAVAQLAGQRCR